jgi:hypothetical protein
LLEADVEQEVFADLGPVDAVEACRAGFDTAVPGGGFEAG